MNIEIVLVIYGAAVALASGLALYNRLDLRRMEKETWHQLSLKTEKRIVTPSRLRKHVPSNPIHQTSPDGKRRIVGYQCSACEDTSVSKGGHTVKQCERYQKEQPKFAHTEEAHDPPMDKAPGAEEPSHDAQEEK